MGLLTEQIIVGLVLATMLALLGSFAILRRLSWFSDGMAHVSLGGLAVAAFTSIAPLPIALIWTIAGALIIYWLEKKTKLPSDALIGILFTSSMAFGIILFEIIGTEIHDFEEALFGGLSNISVQNLWIILILGAIVIFWLIKSYRQLILMGLSDEIAYVAGVPVARQTLFLYITLAITTVLGAKLLGVILVSAMLIIPASIARLISKSFKSYTILSILVSEFIMLTGIYSAAIIGTSPGPIITLIGAGIFVIVMISSVTKIIKN